MVQHTGEIAYKGKQNTAIDKETPVYNKAGGAEDPVVERSRRRFLVRTIAA